MREEGFGALLAGNQMAGEALALLENDRVKAYLNLTDQQVDRLRQIVVETEKASVKMRADMTVRRIELRELLRPDKADHDAVMNKVRELSDLEGQMMKQHVEALLAAKAVLTPEQQKKIRSFIASRAALGGRGEGWGIRQPQATPRVPTPPLVPGRPGEPPVQ
jgi:Spy/CpxP family protein refolding chaperone